jgi:hypothetical protein
VGVYTHIYLLLGFHPRLTIWVFLPKIASVTLLYCLGCGARRAFHWSRTAAMSAPSIHLESERRAAVNPAKKELTAEGLTGP